MTKSISPKNIVLYADDDPDDLELVQEAFSKYSRNVEVLTFSDGSGVISYLERLTEADPVPCLIILDINMPYLNGKEILVRLRQKENFAQVPVVLFTTSSQPLDEKFAVRYNAGFITKPIDLRQMERITAEFIDHCAEDTRNKIRRQMH